MKNENKNLSISIIICTFNSEATIRDTIKSILLQNLKDYEVVVIDNNSTDKTIEIIKSYNLIKKQILIEKDSGVYSAINKGILLANGEIVSILHSSDFYYESSVLKNIVKIFELKNPDIVYGDLIYVREHNKNSILRYWKSNIFKKGSFQKGWSPPHPTFFCKKSVYMKFKSYNEDLGTSSDIELMYRYLEVYNLKFEYLNKLLVVMRYGGISNNSLKNIYSQNISILKFLKIKNNFLKSVIFFIGKFFIRIKQLIRGMFFYE